MKESSFIFIKNHYLVTMHKIKFTKILTFVGKKCKIYKINRKGKWEKSKIYET